MNFTEALNEFRKVERLNSTEGSRGVKNLCRICRAIGYKDDQYFGQFDSKASYGDLIEFLQDNSGAVDAILDWMCENGEYWTENLIDELPEEVLAKYEEDE